MAVGSLTFIAKLYPWHISAKCFR